MGQGLDGANGTNLCGYGGVVDAFVDGGIEVSAGLITKIFLVSTTSVIIGPLGENNLVPNLK